MTRNRYFIGVWISMTLFSSILFNCTTTKNAQETPVSFESIHFGKGGGFSNQTEEYALNNEGLVFKVISDELVEINRVKYSRVKEIDQKLSAIYFDSIDLKEVGNMTYFIEVFLDESSHKVTWADPTDNLDLEDLFKILVATLNNP